MLQLARWELSNQTMAKNKQNADRLAQLKHLPFSTGEAVVYSTVDGVIVLAEYQKGVGVFFKRYGSKSNLLLRKISALRW